MADPGAIPPLREVWGAYSAPLLGSNGGQGCENTPKHGKTR